MKQMNVPSFGVPEGGTKMYKRFRGLDLSSDETQIDDARSPWAVNVIADEGGFPEKRVGWRTVHRFAGCISGIFPYQVGEGEGAHTAFAMHVGDRLVLLDGGAETVLLSGLLTGGRTQGFFMNGKLYLLTGREYLVVDGTAAAHVADKAYIPKTSYGASPAGGGKTYERVNMLTPYRKNSFIADGTAKAFTVDSKKIDDAGEIKVFISGVAKADGWSADRASGTVTFIEAPPAPANKGTDNVEIQFPKTTEGHRQTIEKCRIFALFGMNSDNRVFLSGNPDKASTEWYSGLADPSYFPDINYAVIGSDDFPIMCYVKNQGDLLVIKKDNRQEGTIWHHSAEMTSEGAVFPLREGVQGYGAAARYSAASLRDDPLYLSPRGVYAPVTTRTLVSEQRTVLPRSRRVDRRLCKEKGLENAVAACWNGWYVLAVGGHAYVADGNQDKADNGYEWYYWDNIPAHVLAPHEKTLYFGTSDGRLCRFNDDMVDAENEVLMRAYNDDGAPIHAEWATKLDTMDTPMRLKTMPKRGSGVHLKAYTRAKVEAFVRTEADHGKAVCTFYADRLNFADIDFERFTFSTVKNNMLPLRVKRKKWKAIQVVLKSTEKNEGFGVHSVVIRFLYGNFAKR